MPLRIIFLDLNSYFASVEQAENPALIGKPVAVVPSMAETTCCLAASYPAKAKGVRTGTLVRDARKLCPGIRFIKANHRKYVDYHHRIIEAVERCLPVAKVCSIDEMAIGLFGREQAIDFALAKAREIKVRIRDEVHPALTCSIGIAPNRYLAKIASDMQKPDGLVVINSEELPHRLFSLKLRDFPGIGPRMEERLVAARCTSAKLLCQKTLPEMRQLWGSKVGEDFWNLIRGEEVESKESQQATMSHSRVLPPVERTAHSAWANLTALVLKGAMRLREEGFYAKSLQLNLKFLGNREHGQNWDGRVRFFETQDSTQLLEELTKLWAQAPKDRILRIGIVLGSLVPANKHQLSLFEDGRSARLMGAVDKLNKKMRKNIVTIGTSSELEHASHAPIAFGHIPQWYE